MTDRLVQDSLEEALAEALPRLRAHLRSQRAATPGVDPEDVLQEVCARALRYRASYDPARPFWPWLRTVADRVLTDQRAAGARKPAPLDELDPAAPEGAEPLEVSDELDKLLTQLQPREREILVRFHREEESVREIAKALDMPEGTVKSHLSRARRRLAGLAMILGIAFVIGRLLAVPAPTREHPRAADVILQIEHHVSAPPASIGLTERVVLEPKRVLEWTVEGESP